MPTLIASASNPPGRWRAPRYRGPTGILAAMLAGVVGLTTGGAAAQVTDEPPRRVVVETLDEATYWLVETTRPLGGANGVELVTALAASRQCSGVFVCRHAGEAGGALVVGRQTGVAPQRIEVTLTWSPADTNTTRANPGAAPGLRFMADLATAPPRRQLRELWRQAAVDHLDRLCRVPGRHELIANHLRDRARQEWGLPVERIDWLGYRLSEASCQRLADSDWLGFGPQEARRGAAWWRWPWSPPAPDTATAQAWASEPQIQQVAMLAGGAAITSPNSPQGAAFTADGELPPQDPGRVVPADWFICRMGSPRAGHRLWHLWGPTLTVVADWLGPDWAAPDLGALLDGSFAMPLNSVAAHALGDRTIVGSDGLTTGGGDLTLVVAVRDLPEMLAHIEAADGMPLPIELGTDEARGLYGVPRRHISPDGRGVLYSGLVDGGRFWVLSPSRESIAELARTAAQPRRGLASDAHYRQQSLPGIDEVCLHVPAAWLSTHLGPAGLINAQRREHCRDNLRRLAADQLWRVWTTGRLADSLAPLRDGQPPLVCPSAGRYSLGADLTPRCSCHGCLRAPKPLREIPLERISQREARLAAAAAQSLASWGVTPNVAGGLQVRAQTRGPLQFDVCLPEGLSQAVLKTWQALNAPLWPTPARPGRALASAGPVESLWTSHSAPILPGGLATLRVAVDLPAGQAANPAELAGWVPRLAHIEYRAPPASPGRPWDGDDWLLVMSGLDRDELTGLRRWWLTHGGSSQSPTAYRDSPPPTDPSPILIRTLVDAIRRTPAGTPPPAAPRPLWWAVTPAGRVVVAPQQAPVAAVMTLDTASPSSPANTPRPQTGCLGHMTWQLSPTMVWPALSDRLEAASAWLTAGRLAGADLAARVVGSRPETLTGWVAQLTGEPLTSPQGDPWLVGPGRNLACRHHGPLNNLAVHAASGGSGDAPLDAWQRLLQRLPTPWRTLSASLGTDSSGAWHLTLGLGDAPPQHQPWRPPNPDPALAAHANSRLERIEVYRLSGRETVMVEELYELAWLFAGTHQAAEARQRLAHHHLDMGTAALGDLRNRISRHRLDYPQVRDDLQTLIDTYDATSVATEARLLAAQLARRTPDDILCLAEAAAAAGQYAQAIGLVGSLRARWPAHPLADQPATRALSLWWQRQAHHEWRTLQTRLADEALAPPEALALVGDFRKRYPGTRGDALAGDLQQRLGATTPADLVARAVDLAERGDIALASRWAAKVVRYYPGTLAERQARQYLETWHTRATATAIAALSRDDRPPHEIRRALTELANTCADHPDSLALVHQAINDLATRQAQHQLAVAGSLASTQPLEALAGLDDLIASAEVSAPKVAERARQLRHRLWHTWADGQLAIARAALAANRPTEAFEALDDLAARANFAAARATAATARAQLLGTEAAIERFRSVVALARQLPTHELADSARAQQLADALAGMTADFADQPLGQRAAALLDELQARRAAHVAQAAQAALQADQTDQAGRLIAQLAQQFARTPHGRQAPQLADRLLNLEITRLAAWLADAKFRPAQLRLAELAANPGLSADQLALLRTGLERLADLHLRHVNAARTGPQPAHQALLGFLDSAVHPKFVLIARDWAKRWGYPLPEKLSSR